MGIPMPIPLVYPYKATANDGADLRLSLRGVDRYLHLADGVLPVVVGAAGAKPTWLAEECWVEAEELPSGHRGDGVYSGVKTRNIVAALLRGMEHLQEAHRYEGDVLYMNDDFILMEPREDVLRLRGGSWAQFRGWLSRWEKNPEMAWYVESTRATDRMLRDARLLTPLTNWETHAPMWMEAARAKGLLRALLCQPVDAMAFPRTMYGNLIGYPGQRTYHAADPWLGGLSTVGMSWVSVNEEATAKAMRALVEGRLKAASRWERT